MQVDRSLAEALSHQLNHLYITGIAVGLSGGGDSWALALLAHDYAKARHIPFIALTVDHRLRPESGDEAASVAKECARRGIPHRTLTWQHEGIVSRKQEQARGARYTLMGDYCAAHGFSHLLVAHHADDQAETVLLRFAKGSGSAGLAAMAPSRALNDQVILLRPFLGIPKEDLLAYAENAGVPVIEDPSNRNPAYARARLRNAADVLAKELVELLRAAKSDGARIRALRGIANSAYDGAVPSIRPLLKAEQPSVRAAAIEAVRLVKTPLTDELVAQTMTQETSNTVRSAAIRVAAGRAPTDTLVSALSETALRGEDAVTRQQAVELIANWLPQRQNLRATLEQVAERDQEPRIRDVALAALKKS